ncbi:hypothetical protein KI387_032372 [Taxus chinensis]|uniref:4-coumarate--CoA ligase n=1 Tax=Taxus chinensis TaxID=29808 RepID=A0AA38BNV7_TAXCH|nr:hypothetical protein KI387_032372 [Taxus chinensis]
MSTIMSHGRIHVGHSLNIIKEVRADMTVTICGITHQTGMQFLDRVAALANGLIQLGLKEGNAVAIAALNSDLYLEWMLAVMCAGCIVVPLNYRWSFEEAFMAVAQVGPVMLVVDNFCLAWSKGFMNRIPSLCFHVFLGEDLDLQNAQLISAESIGVHAGGFKELGFRWAPDSVALICFTSGTTESPKGVAISHDALVVQSQAKIAFIGYNHNDIYLHTSPLCHIGGISSALSIVLAGGCHVFLPKFEAASAVFAIQRHSVSAMITVPTMLADIATYCINSRSKKEGSNLCFSTVQKILNGAGSMSPQLIKNAIEIFPRARIFSAYGMTEACSSMTFTLVHDPMIKEDTCNTIQDFSMTPPNKNNFQNQRIGICVGNPAPHVEIQIDPRTECLNGDKAYNVGNILTRGPHVMLKYWGQKEATAAALSENRWLNTGDVGWIDKEGKLWLLGRSMDMIKSGGENVYPSEVEKVLLKHPGILVAVVVGIPDPRLTETVSASIQLGDGWHWEDKNLALQNHVAGNKSKNLSPKLLQLYCKQQGLSGFKVPRIFLLQKEPFPRTTTGKVKRDAIKTQILLKLSLEPCELNVARSKINQIRLCTGEKSKGQSSPASSCFESNNHVAGGLRNGETRGSKEANNIKEARGSQERNRERLKVFGLHKRFRAGPNWLSMEEMAEAAKCLKGTTSRGEAKGGSPNKRKPSTCPEAPQKSHRTLKSLRVSGRCHTSTRRHFKDKSKERRLKHAPAHHVVRVREKHRPESAKYRRLAEGAMCLFSASSKVNLKVGLPDKR